MNVADKILLVAIGECEPGSFAEISLSTRMATDYLGLQLDDLQTRGFIHLRHGRYTLAKGVREGLLQLSA